MVFGDNAWSIRSRHGLLRDLIPIYSLQQLVPNLLVAGIILWLSQWLGHFPTIGFFVVMLGWVFQFMTRPSEMIVSAEQAAWLERVLDMQEFYGRCEVDDRWRLIGQQWWQRWPHQSIEFAPGDNVTVIAPRDAMESLRDCLEAAEEHGDLLFAADGAFSFEPAEPEVLPRHLHVPAILIGALCVLAWLWHVFTTGSQSMGNWGVSGAALSDRRFETIVLHMFAHGGTMHLAMNMSMLAAIGGTLTRRLGPTPLNWLRFLLLFLLSGLAGAALFLALHPMGSVPMLGASGALYGLFGLLIRAPSDGGDMLEITSSRIRRKSWDLVKQNAFLFALLALMAWSAGKQGGLAWEAHLGGFLFGLLLGPKFLPRSAAASLDVRTAATPAAETRLRAD